MKIKSLVIVLTAMLLSLTSIAQHSVNHKKDNLLFLLRQKEHINQAIKTIDQLMADKSSLDAGKIVIIVCGEAVTSLTTQDAVTWIQQTEKYKNVSLVACGLSMDKFQKKKEDLVQGVQYTRNGFIKAFELQKQGYLSVEL